MTCMLATRGTLADLSRPNTIVDQKLDGYRILATREGDTVHLISRQGTDLTFMSPQVCAGLLELPLDSFTLDCELVAYDPNGISQLPLLLNNYSDRHLVAFDCLDADRIDVRSEPLYRRKELLTLLVADRTDRISESVWTDTEGPALFEQYTAQNGEGVICKRSDSEYSAGRTKDWRKIKPSYLEAV